MKVPALLRRHRTTVVRILLHPVTLALAFSVLLILLFLPPWPKYRADLAEARDFNRTLKVLFFSDLDGDGYSEIVGCEDNPVGTGAVSVRFDNTARVIQWNVAGSFNFLKTNFFGIGDYDGNGKREVNVVTLSGDSILLNVIDYRLLNRPLFKDIFIDTVGKHKGMMDPDVVMAPLVDLDGDGFKEIIFTVNTGFSVYPRNIYAVDLKKQKVVRSPENAYNISIMYQADVNGDGWKELIPIGYTSENVPKSKYVYHDSSSWLMVMDKDLDFLFPPVEIPSEKVDFLPLVDTFSHGKAAIFALTSFPYETDASASLTRYDEHGRCIRSRKIDPFITSRPISGFLWNIRGNRKILIALEERACIGFDTSFNYLGKLEIDLTNGRMYPMDVDLDGEKEMVIPDLSRENITILREDMTSPAVVNVPLLDMSDHTFSLKEARGKKPLLAAADGERRYLITYRINPMFYWQWLIYLGVFAGVLAFTLAIQRIQRVQMQRRYDTEKKITELQLKIVRNQMDPHFVMNAINSVIGAVQREEKEEASRNLLSFSNMYRSLVLSADKIKRTLKEELEFTENYLSLEQFRFRGKFRYEVLLDPSVDLGWEVPKMVLQIHVENAVKHGIKGKAEGGLITIRGYRLQDNLCLEVTDNGMGRTAASGDPGKSTGKGLKMMDQFYDLYYKITGKRVNSEITDLFDEEGKPAGTRVKVTVPGP